MLTKKNLSVGQLVIVNEKIYDGATIGGNHLIPTLRIWKDGDYTGMSVPYEIPPNMLLEIVRRPRKVGNINLARVKSVYGEGEVYWNELRCSCRYT